MVSLLRDRWYKDALIYEVSVRTFQDSNGDGIGDLRGLIGRLDYLSGLGVTCLWLLPFYPSPWRDDGYDITDYYAVHPELGDLGDFVDLVHAADDRGIRVIADLVLNHTSNRHPWFLAAREGDPVYRDFYVWADEKPPEAEKGIEFPGVQKSTWSYDRTAGRYYFHRFYDFQPDLNIANPTVRHEMEKIIGFWVELGIAGYRLDAAPFLIEPAGAEGIAPGPRFDYLRQLREQLSWRRGDAVLLGEANVERDQAEDYYALGGMHMLFNFEADRSLWLALARQDARPLVRALTDTTGIPETDQWATFVRNHDEVDLSRLSDEEREDVFAAFAPDPSMQLYDRGIRRRIAPMLGGDRRRIELVFSLLFSLPGTPVMYYGDEIGMGEDLSLPEREPVRTPMQWADTTNAGFSSARKKDLSLPVISRGPFGYRKVNVAEQQRDTGSLLNWVERAIVARAEAPGFGTGTWWALETGTENVMALEYRHGDRRTVTVHNLANRKKRARVEGVDGAWDVFANRPYAEQRGDEVEIDGYGYRWMRLRADRRRTPDSDQRRLASGP
jgi:maltose alpha-D-glucosyltransferase / alpha-amylase